MRSSFLSLAAVVVFSLLTAPAAAAIEPTGCPSTVIVAARGTNQNADSGQYIGPQQYSEAAAASNGYEGENLSGLFHLVEQRHPGVMDRVFVLGLDPQTYPATMGVPSITQEGEKTGPLEMLRRLGGFLWEHPLFSLPGEIVGGFNESIRAGIANAPAAVDAYEQSSGCTPQYVVTGYSQGALIGRALEEYLAPRGRLVGAVYIGNPLDNLPDGAPHRISYCLSGDYVCGFSIAAAVEALLTGAERHASYFKNAPTPEDERVADQLAEWVSAQ